MTLLLLLNPKQYGGIVPPPDVVVDTSDILKKMYKGEMYGPQRKKKSDKLKKELIRKFRGDPKTLAAILEEDDYFILMLLLEDI